MRVPIHANEGVDTAVGEIGDAADVPSDAEGS
jgi:hypothetical protein